MPFAHVLGGPESLGKLAFPTKGKEPLRGKELGVVYKAGALEAFTSIPPTEPGGEGSP